MSSAVSKGVMLELIERPEGHPDAARARECAYVDHLAYEVEDPAEALRECRALDMDVIEGVVDIPTFWPNGFQICAGSRRGRRKSGILQGSVSGKGGCNHEGKDCCHEVQKHVVGDLP